MIQRALISVSDKTNLLELGWGLAELGIEIISTGGTARVLREAGIPVTPIELVTGYPEMLGGRVKTLHPKVHGGLLARRNVADDQADLHRSGIVKIELLAVNLYPFEETVSQPDVSLEDAIEQIDIGGVALLRAAAKNYHDVTVLSDPSDYLPVLAQLREKGEVDLETRSALSVRAFQKTARYDTMIATYLERVLQATHPIRREHGVDGDSEPDNHFPPRLSIEAELAGRLRYGENPHQAGALYRVPATGGLASAIQRHGKGMSYTNWLDAEGAWIAAEAFEDPAVVIVKHASPCGIAVNESLAQAWKDALASDPVSAFGGVVAVNRTITQELAEAMDGTYTEVILAPGYDDEAIEHLTKKRNRRLLEVPSFSGNDTEVRAIPGGFIVQERDRVETEIAMEVASRRSPTDAEIETMRFAWRALLAVKSNAIVFARRVQGGFATVGIGAGQPNRVDAVRLAAMKAGASAVGAVMASDAFFPFPDGVEVAREAGVTAIIQPGGSIRDDEVVAAANAGDLSMVFTHTRHFRH